MVVVEDFFVVIDVFVEVDIGMIIVDWVEGYLVFCYVCFGYFELCVVVFNDIMFMCRLGIVMVLVGCFGSGKSMLVSLVLWVFDF